MKPGLFQILVIVLIVLVLFGRGRIGEVLGDFGRGIRSFRKGLGEEGGATPRVDGPGGEPQPAPEAAADKTTG